jgi:FkbM family methyltransferase
LPTTLPILLRLIWQHPANHRRRTRAITKAALWQIYKRTIAHPFLLPVYDGLRLRAYPDSREAGRFIYYGGLPDFEEMTFMMRYLRTGDRFIDGGANVGAYTLLAAKLVGRSGRVDAFEPAPLEFGRLRENVLLNRLGQVHVHEAALAEVPGRAAFTVDRSSGNRLRRADDAMSQVATVRVTTLDQALGPAMYAMAKLDLEGAEPLALRGGERHLAARNPPVILLELVDRFVRRFGTSAVDVATWLRDRGYELAEYDVSNNRITVRDRSLIGSRTNVFAVALAELPFVTSRLAGGFVGTSPESDSAVSA